MIRYNVCLLYFICVNYYISSPIVYHVLLYMIHEERKKIFLSKLFFVGATGSRIEEVCQARHGGECREKGVWLYFKWSLNFSSWFWLFEISIITDIRYSYVYIIMFYTSVIIKDYKIIPLNFIRYINPILIKWAFFYSDFFFLFLLS